MPAGPPGELLKVSKAGEGAGGYCLDPLECDMFILYRNTGMHREQCPIRVGKVVRMNLDLEVPSLVSEAWWPVLKPEKFGDRLNMFGTWVQSAKPVSWTAPPAHKKPALSSWTATQCVMLNISDVLVWPVTMESGASEYTAGVRIPFSAIDHLWAAHQVSLGKPEFTFSDRGKAFFEESMWRWHSDRQARS